MKSILGLVATLSVAVWLPANACTLAANTTLESSLEGADGVVLAEVIEGSRTAVTSDPTDAYPVETVRFKVLDVFKGRFEPGSILKFETAIGPGSCGWSIDREMRLLVATPPKKLPGGEIWILFLNGPQPYALGRPSGRIGDGAERNLRQLHEFAARPNSPSN